MVSKADLGVPKELLSLYRHWQILSLEPADVLRTPKDLRTSLNQDLLLVDSIKILEIVEFARTRMQAWVNRQNGVHPTSSDPVIAKFKFCNIYRELDRQTIHFHTKLNAYYEDFNFWLLNMFACRFLANIETVDKLGFLETGAPNQGYCAKLKSLNKPKFGNAYVFPISTIQKSPWPTREEFLSLYLPIIIEDVAAEILIKKGRTVNQLLASILPIFGFNLRFLWTEVLIDVHYQFPDLVDLSKDFYIGPGAKPSLEYLHKGSTSLSLVLNFLVDDYAYIEVVNLSIEHKLIPLSAENWEGICCEFRKYQNLKNGRGRRRLYLAG